MPLSTKEDAWLEKFNSLLEERAESSYTVFLDGNAGVDFRKVISVLESGMITCRNDEQVVTFHVESIVRLVEYA